MQSSYNAEEVAKFEAMAEDWWNPEGKFKPLHQMNPCRLGYICDQIAWHFKRNLDEARPFSGLDIVDIGSGGGLLCEPLTRLGGNLLGIDAAPKNANIAALHAKAQNLSIEYETMLAEDLAKTARKFDVVLAMEIIEHVHEPAQFVKTLKSLMKADGLLIVSTLNRNAKSYLFAIIGAEYVLGWLPKGTHDWNRFLTPDELATYCQNSALEVIDRIGFVFNPLTQSWSQKHGDLSVNYAIAAINHQG